MKVLSTDVLIVGGGPAGSSAAISLLMHAGLSVTIIEQSNLNQVRVGEHVSPAIFDVLKYLDLGVDDFKADCFSPSYGTTSYWGSDTAVVRDSIFTTDRSSAQLDRGEFDLTLLKKVADLGGVIFPRTKCTKFIQTEDDTWQVTANHLEKGAFLIEARYLIDASGRQASVSRQLNVPLNKHDQLVGVGAFLKFNQQVKPCDQMIETTELGWWYNATLKHNTTTTVFFSDADIIADHELHKQDNWTRLLQQTKYIKHRTAGASIDEINPWVRNAGTHIANVSTCKNFLPVGDAAASFDPISSMGLGFAITCACNAAAIVPLELDEHKTERIATYQNDLTRIFNNYLNMRGKVYQQEKRWPSSKFWIRRSG